MAASRSTCPPVKALDLGLYALEGLAVGPVDVDLAVGMVGVELQGPKSKEARQVLSTAYLRELTPPSMSIWLAPNRPKS